MKKLLGFAFGLLAAVGLHAQATNTPTYTPTPNATQTQAAANIQATQTAVAATATYVQTAFPTLTPTLTPTGTLTPSPTFTPNAQTLVPRPNGQERNYILPTQFLSSAGTGLPTLAQDSNDLTYFAFTSGGTTVRAQWKVPQDFKGGLNIYADLLCSALGVTTADFTVDANGYHMGLTTQTAGTYSYFVPGGSWSATGSSTNVVVSSYGATAGGNSLFPGVAGSYSEVVSRVMLPLPFLLNGFTSNPTGIGTPIRPGDLVNVSIAGTTTSNVNLYALEFSYDYSWDTNQ